MPSTALDTSADDYARMTRAITFLRAQHLQQPDLAMLAEHLELSEFHVQKLFSRWAGISPKRFVQFLTVEFAKRNMAHTADLLSLSLQAGLSGPGRLHDLFVTMEAMTPGEYKHAGAGVVIRYALGATPFGQALIARTERGICHLAFDNGFSVTSAQQFLQGYWPHANLKRDDRSISDLLQPVFNPGKDIDQALRLRVKGSNFQIQVWRALLQIPFGGVVNYGQLAAQLGKPKAARAVGNAVAKNPVAYLIPCHRVIRQSGDFGKYLWGEERKSAMLAWEAARREVSVE